MIDVLTQATKCATPHTYAECTAKRGAPVISANIASGTTAASLAETAEGAEGRAAVCG